ncbi:MAG TPA: AMP-binding protein [Candidatus Dietzia intestinipullorum]|nr:AMP-binding protein [Candidatus Dietzia intestinipullorum]
MDGTMLDTPLLVSRILDHAAHRHAGSSITDFDDTLRPRTTRFDELAGRAAATAHALAELGVDGGDVVGLLTGDRTDAVEALFAIPSMGAVAMPLNFLLPRDVLATVLDENRVRVLLVDPALFRTAVDITAGLEHLRHLVVMGHGDIGDPGDLGDRDVGVHARESLLDGRPTSFPWPAPDERTAAVISHTSGTTGPAKAVVYTHRSIWLHSMQMCAADSAALNSGDTVLSTIPIHHVVSWGQPFAALMAGASMVLARPRAADALTTGDELAALLRTYRPNKLTTTPGALQMLLRRLETHPQQIGHLHEVLVGGSAMPPALFDAFVDRHGLTILHAYGLTETSPLVAVARADRHSSATDRRMQMLGQGRLPAAVEARIVEGDTVLPHDGSSVGELQLRGPWVTARYQGDPHDRWSRFDDGWLRTGDMASISPKGYLDVVDRVDDIIRSGGEWISSVELGNAVLLDSRVTDAAVVGVPDERWGSRPFVLVNLKSGVTATARSLWRSLADSVELWQRPDHWAFVDQIPRTSVGKYDKRTIRARHAAGDYDVTTISPGR